MVTQTVGLNCQVDIYHASASTPAKKASWKGGLHLYTGMSKARLSPAKAPRRALFEPRLPLLGRDFARQSGVESCFGRLPAWALPISLGRHRLDQLRAAHRFSRLFQHPRGRIEGTHLVGLRCLSFGGRRLLFGRGLRLALWVLLRRHVSISSDTGCFLALRQIAMPVRSAQLPRRVGHLKAIVRGFRRLPKRRPQPALVGPFPPAGNRLKLGEVHGCPASVDAWQKEQLLLDVRSQEEEVHDLRDPGPANMSEASQC